MAHHYLAQQAATGLPVETGLGTIAGLHLLGVSGVPPMYRKADTPPDRTRRQFLEFHLSELTSSTAFDTFVETIMAAWARALPELPSCYVAGSSLPGLSRSSGYAPTRRDRVTAATILLRSGFLVLDGSLVSGVTRAGPHISSDGKRFIMGEEGDGSHLYWPGGEKSGDTLGPGYDLGNRQAPDVLADMTAAGVSAARAMAIFPAIGRVGDNAKKYANQHVNDITLSGTEQGNLFDQVVPDFEDAVHNILSHPARGRLFQYELDALISLAFNITAYATHDVSKDVNRLDMISAASDWLTLSGGGPGIPDRRRREALMFEDCLYICKEVRYQ